MSDRPTLDELFEDGRAIDEALKEAARDARRLHKALGTQWRRGRRARSCGSSPRTSRSTTTPMRRALMVAYPPETRIIPCGEQYAAGAVLVFGACAQPTGKA